MLRTRLEARVGRVDVLGPARLEGHRHSFTKLGRDGTGKGNITPAPGHDVHGVLYRLSTEQLVELRGFEGGYRQLSLAVEHRRSRLHAETFQALRPVAPMRPTSEYLDYYRRGMNEHGLPRAYRAMVVAQAMSMSDD